jgi:hypothetical protein
MDKIAEAVDEGDWDRAKSELLAYFIKRKNLRISYSEPITKDDRNPSLAYIARHCILPGPNEADTYLASLFVSRASDFVKLDLTPFLKKKLSFMIMSRQKESEAAFLFSPHSMFPPCLIVKTSDGRELKILPEKFAYVSTKEPDFPLSEEDIYEICEESASPDEAFGVNTGRVYLSFDLSECASLKIQSVHFSAKITLPESIDSKELLIFNVADSSWDNSLTWSKILGNVYSWESSTSGPSWDKPEGSDSEYLNVICRFLFARPMASQYLSDVDKNKIYGEKLLFLMDSFSKKKEGGYNRVLETGERLSNFTAVLGALIDTPAMTGDLLVSILSAMYKDMKHLIENPDLGWSNWAVVRTSGLSKAIDFLPELKAHSDWRSKTRDVMDSLIDKMYSPDFSFRESGFAYSFWCMELFISAFCSAQMNNDPYSAFMRVKLEKALDASLDLLYPNLYDTNIGDSNYCDKTPLLMKLAKMFPTKKLSAFLAGGIGRSAFYSYSNTAVMKGGSNSDDALYLLVQASPFDGHAHSDQSSLVFYAYDRPLITDSGRYGYSSSDISAFLKTTSSHNMVEIESCESAPHSESESEITLFASNSAFDLVKLTTRPYKGLDAKIVRTILLVKGEKYAIVSDAVFCDKSTLRFNQNWHFMPFSAASVDYSNNIETHFSNGANIKLFCPSADIASVESSVFSAGYGMAEPSQKGVFTKYGQNTSFTTLLLPSREGESRTASAREMSASDNSFSAASFTIDSSSGVFYTKNLSEGEIESCSFDGETVYIAGDKIFLAAVKKLYINSTLCIESEKVINDMYMHISGGVVIVESSSLHPTTLREEAIKIYAPKTTHVLFNGSPVPFTLYSDYVYALGV